MVFVSLTHARAVANMLCSRAVRDFVRDDEIQKLFTYAVRVRSQIQRLKSGLQRSWVGEGIPDWSYLDELGDAIDYISKEERRRTP
jgi:hypothetical protein